MNILENIKEIIGPISPEEIVVSLIGLSVFAIWLYRTSLGRRALEDSVPRRNNMPLFMPLVIIFGIFLLIGLSDQLVARLAGDLTKWKQDFLGELTNCIMGLISIGIILIFVKRYFVRGIKGFGLNIKTIPKDFGMSLLYLFAVWPVMNIVFIVTVVVNKLISGPEYVVPVHVELQTLSQDTSILVRITLTVGVALITPFLEEMLFRGLFQSAIRSSLNTKYAAWIAIFITSLFFVVNHANPSHWPILFVLSSCMGYAYEKSGSLFRPIFIHILFNASGILFTWLK